MRLDPDQSIKYRVATGLNLEELYKGSKGPDGEVLLHPIRNRQNYLVERSVDAVLAVAAEQAFLEQSQTEVDKTSPGYAFALKGKDPENAFKLLSEKGLLNEQTPLGQTINETMYRNLVKNFFREYNGTHWEKMKGLDPEIDISKPEIDISKIVDSLLVVYLKAHGILKSADDIKKTLNLAKYEQNLENFRTEMNEYKHDLDQYIQYILTDKRNPDSKLPEDDIRQGVLYLELREVEKNYENIRTDHPEDYKELMYAARDRINAYAKEWMNYASEIQAFRDGGVFPKSEPTLDYFKIRKPPESPYHKVPEHPLVKFVHEFFQYDVADIRETGEKNAFNALVKWKKILGLPENDSTGLSEAVTTNNDYLTDLTRLTIVPKTPEIATALAWHLMPAIGYDGNHFVPIDSGHIQKTGWRIYETGYIDEKIKMAYVVPGSSVATCSEIKLENQVEADVMGHRIYEVARLLMDDKGKFKIPVELTAAQVKLFHEGYERVMKHFSEHTNKYKTQASKPMQDFGYRLKKHPKNELYLPVLDDDSSLVHAKLRERYDELLLLNQSIHVAAAENSLPEWRDLYLKKALEFNERQEALGLPRRIDEELLERLMPSEKMAKAVLNKRGNTNKVVSVAM